MHAAAAPPPSVRRPRLEVGVDRGPGRVVDVDSRSSEDVRSVYHHARVGGLRPGTTHRDRIDHGSVIDRVTLRRPSRAGE